jgi:putative YphP/YqiW family bacilliredoxin
MTRMGAKELTTEAEVDTALGDQREPCWSCELGPQAAPPATRPALRLALDHPVRPQQIVTVFAGQDCLQRREPDSTSPTTSRAAHPWHCCATGRWCTPVHRHQIEGRTPQSIAADLTSACSIASAQPRSEAGGDVDRPLFHPGHHELHGITVVIETHGSRTYVGRFDSEDQQGCTCWTPAYTRR